MFWAASVPLRSDAEVVAMPLAARAAGTGKETYLTNFGRLIGAADFSGTQVVMPDSAVDQADQLDLGNRNTSCCGAWAKVPYGHRPDG